MSDLQSLVGDVHIFDVMAIMQQSPASMNAFGEISDYILNQVMKYPVPKIFFITDQYYKRLVEERSIELSESQHLAETN